MLSVPQYGWVDISIEDWKDRASYLTDVPHDLLDKFNNMFEKHGSPVAVGFDAEGWEYIIVFDWYTTYIIESKDTEKLYVFDKCFIEFAEEVYDDISSHIVEWSNWDYNVESEEIRLNEEKVLKEKLNKLRMNIDSYKKRYK